ncbi:hypothetical protein Bca52824_007811 [Brassica carinata]|uniref:Uncharacterized protein n=1 Tax=Brassica carinata TaxID=52824 RepID=A0A8X7W6W2_BRACI|nr:hypothetical protein Bca52824_007811 [Brassica carinata]
MSSPRWTVISVSKYYLDGDLGGGYCVVLALVPLKAVSHFPLRNSPTSDSRQTFKKEHPKNKFDGDVAGDKWKSTSYVVCLICVFDNDERIPSDVALNLQKKMERTVEILKIGDFTSGHGVAEGHHHEPPYSE